MTGGVGVLGGTGTGMVTVIGTVTSTLMDMGTAIDPDTCT